MGEPADGWAGSVNRFVAAEADTPNAFGGWWEHVRDFEQLMAQLPSRALIVEYEALHTDMQGSLQRLAALLGPEAEARLTADGAAIQEALSFGAMKEAAGEQSKFYRKGVRGGWREHCSTEDEKRIAAATAARLPKEQDSVAGLGTWREELLA